MSARTVLRRVALRLAIALGVLSLGVTGGLYAAAGLAPERLRAEVEAILEKAVRGPVEMASLRLVLGFPLHLEATDLVLWEGDLRIQHASARVDVFSLLIGRPRLTRLVLDGAVLEVRRAPRGVGADGTLADGPNDWQPEPFGRIAAKGRLPRAEPALTPIRAVESAVGFLLEKPRLADTLEVRRSAIVYRDLVDMGAAAPLRFERVRGRLSHSRLRRDSELLLFGSLVEAGGRRQGGRGLGAVEWIGRRDRSGALEISVAVTDADLQTLLPYLGRPETAHLRGRLSGIADYAAGTDDSSVLDLDLVVHDFETGLTLPGLSRSVSWPRLATRMRVGLDPGHVQIGPAQIRGGDVDLGVHAVVARPVGPGSNAGLTLALEDLELGDARAVIGWLPEGVRQPALELAGTLRAGRVRRVSVQGGASLEGWRDLILGRARALPRRLRVDADLEGLVIAVGEEDLLEDVGGHIAWSDDAVEVVGARGTLDGEPLPLLDASLSGVSHLLVSDPGRRVIPSGARSLQGLTPLWEMLQPGAPDSEGGLLATRARVELDRIEHPALLWPFEDLHAELVPLPDGLRVAVTQGVWAGVPLHGVVDGRFRPERHVSARFTASAPTAVGAEDAPNGSEAAPPTGHAGHGSDDPVWASGRLEIGAIDATSWRQRGASAEFHAMRGELHFEAIEAELLPSGRLSARASLDLDSPDRVPYAFEVELEDGDLAALLGQAGFEPDVVTGHIGVRGGLEGNMVPGGLPLVDATGSIQLRAVNGTIRRSVPPVMAVALASESFAGFSARDRLRYNRAAATLTFGGGRIETDALDVEGPDLRLFASGGVDLAAAPHTLDAEVVLFLFRQIDRAIGKIPVLNVLLLGSNENLMAAYYELAGPWEDPVATVKPLRSLATGPGSMVLEGIPSVVRRGMEAIGALLRPMPPASPGDPFAPASLRAS